MKISSPSVSFDQIKESDIETLLEIQIANHLSVWSFDDYKKLLKDESSFKIAARNKRKVIGFLLGRLITTWNEIYLNELYTNEAEIYNIAVCNSYKRLGIGTKLLNSLLEICRAKSIETIWLEVRESNKGAIGFYTKNNFKQEGIRKNYYGNPSENAVIMKLTCRDKKKQIVGKLD